MATSEPGGPSVELAGVLLVVSVLLVLAFILLTVSLMRLRGTTRELEATLADESGARDRAALLLAIASAVNSSLALEEVLNVALTHAGRIMGAVAGAMYLVRPGKADLYREASYNLTNRARAGLRKVDEEPLSSAIGAMRPLVVKLDEHSAPGLELGGHPQHALVVPIQRSGQLMGAIDLYHFKQVNDTYGHLNGDAVLHELAQILPSSARESYVCARYGGEEFALILHETTESGAKILAERIRSKVAAATFPGGLKLTISIGVSATDDATLFTQLMDRADQALYAAKQGGRNQVRVADMKGPAPKSHMTKPEVEAV